MTLKIEKSAVLLEGGPRDGWSYFEDEMDALVRVEEYFGRTFPYRSTGRFEVHPRTNGQVMSRVWEWTGQPDIPEPVTSWPQNIPPRDDSKLREVFDVIALGGEQGATGSEIELMTGYPPAQTAPLIGSMLVGKAIRHGPQRGAETAYIALSTTEPDPWDFA